MPPRVPGAAVRLPGYAFDPRLRGYGYVDLATGRLVSKSLIHGLLQDQADRAAATMGEIARAAQQGLLTPRQFYEAMQREVKTAYNVDVALARGGWNRVTPRDYRVNGGHLKDEYRRLRDFAQDLADGKLTEKQAVARAKLYADSAYQRYWQIQQEQQEAAGLDQEHWQTVGDERVCFPAWTMVATEMGMMPIQRIKPGMRVWTRSGLQTVVATSRRKYHGEMATVRAGTFQFTATIDHPVWTLEQGWLECGNLNSGHTLETFDKQHIKVSGRSDFSLGNAADAPAVSGEKPVFAFISSRVTMPVFAVDFKCSAMFGEQEVNAITANCAFLNIGNIQHVKRLPDHALDAGLTRELAITGKGAKATICGTGEFSELFPASCTDRDNGRSSAFFGTIVPIKVLFGAKRLAATLAHNILSFSKTTCSAANSVSVAVSTANRKGFSALWADLRNAGFLSVFGSALNRTISFVPFYPRRVAIDGLSADAAGDFGSGSTGRGITRSAAISMGTPYSLMPFKWCSAFFAGVLKHATRSATYLSLVYHRLSRKAIDVYDLSIDGSQEFYANSVLVHNCPVCHGLEAQGWVAIGTLPLPGEPHLGCRCEKEYRQAPRGAAAVDWGRVRELMTARSVAV